MQNYNYGVIVSRTEVEALKELIFNRARQRAEAMAKDAQNQYTSSFREEIMDIARDSFNASGNPFSQKITQEKKESTEKIEKNPQVGFEQKTDAETIQQMIKARNESVRATASQNAIASVMDNAGSEFQTTQKFTGALEFLNSQAGIYMAGQRQARFDKLA